MKTLKFQLLDSKLEVINSFRTQKDLLNYTDTLNNFGIGLIIFNSKTSKSVQLV